MKDDLLDIDLLEMTEEIERNAEFIPLITLEEEDKMNKEVFPNELPILPLRNNVLFPGVVIPITVARDKSIKLIKDAYKGDKIIGVVSQRNQEDDSPELDDLHQIGTIAQIIRMLKMPDGSTTVIIQGKRRFKIVKENQSIPYLRATIKVLTDKKHPKNSKEMDAVFTSIKENALEII